MNSKALLLALAAFTLTTTGARAYGGSMLSRAGLSSDQVEVAEEACKSRVADKSTEAHDMLVGANITEKKLHSRNRLVNEVRDAIRNAVENRDYGTFKRVAADSPISDIITSKSDFEQFCEAYGLQQTGDWKGVDEIMDDLGFEDNGSANRHAPFVGDFSTGQKKHSVWLGDRTIEPPFRPFSMRQGANHTRSVEVGR